MTSSPTTEGQRTLDGTLRVFLAEALILPTGLITTGVLTRGLGLEGYGLFTLAATLVGWIEWNVMAVFSNATYKCIGEAPDWRPVGTTVLRLHLGVSAAAAALLAALAGPIAGALGEPSLAGFLRLYAIDIPIFTLACAHRDILIATGGFRHRAWLGAARWLVRLALIVALVALGGWSVTGAIVAMIGTSVVELALARRFIRPSWFGLTTFPARKLWGTAAPLLGAALVWRVIDKFGLFLLKALGATAAQAAVYGVAQNLTVVAGLVAMAFAPLLLSTITRLLRDDREAHARLMGRDAMRLAWLLVPMAGLSAGASGEVVGVIAGRAFAPAGPLLAVLIFQAVAAVLAGIASAILIAAGKSTWNLRLTVPMLPIALAAQVWAIPRYGALGAAAVTTVVTVGAAAALVGAVWRLWRVTAPAASILRSLLLCAGAWAWAAAWPTAGAWLAIKLMVIAVAVLASFVVLGEFSRREIMLAWSLVPGLTSAEPRGSGYWEEVGEAWQGGKPDPLWRAHSDAVNRRWLAAVWPGRPVDRALKTDMFDEAAGEGVFGFLRARSRCAVGMDVARSTSPHVVADVRRLPFDREVFDVVVSNSTLDHFETEAELVESLRELRQVLRPGGELLLTLDNPLNPIVALRNVLPFELLNRLALTPYRVGCTCGPRRLRRLLGEAGFEVADVRALLHCPRVAAVKWASRVEQSGDAARRARLFASLLTWERLARWPTRWLTGYFVAVKAVRRS